MPRPSGAPSRPNRRLGLRLLRPTQTTCRCSDKAAGRAGGASLGLPQRQERALLPSYEAIAEAAGCAKSTVADAIKALEDTGIILTRAEVEDL